MLLPRILHVDTMILWDCFEGHANKLNRRHVEQVEFSRNPTSSVETSRGESLLWGQVVNEYSQREVLYKRDRLPALARLTARFAQARGYTYLAGLWLKEMPRSLLWERCCVGREACPYAD